MYRLIKCMKNENMLKGRAYRVHREWNNRIKLQYPDVTLLHVTECRYSSDNKGEQMDNKAIRIKIAIPASRQLEIYNISQTLEHAFERGLHVKIASVEYT